MRYAVLVFGILGAGLACTLAGIWLYNMRGEDEAIKKWEKAEGQGAVNPNSKSARMRKQLDAITLAAYVMIAGGVIGLVAAILAFLRKMHPLLAGVILLIGSVVAGFLEQRGLIATAPLLVAAVLCLFMKTKRRNAAPVAIAGVGAGEIPSGKVGE